MDDKVTLHTLQKMKANGERITMLTAYDYPTALILDRSEIDVLLVGDSLGMVVHGLPNTLAVTMDDMIRHCRAVARGAKRAYLVGDMPFMSYQVTIEEAKRNAARFLSEGGMDAVKVEGGQKIAATIRALVDVGIAVMGHIGLTPQSISAVGGFKAQGKTAEAARHLLADARALEAAGVFSIVLECVPDRVAAHISGEVSVPTIGIGAGVGCDGQVLVTHDVLGLFDRFTPKFVKRYARLAPVMQEAFEAFREEVRAGVFPAAEHSFTISDDEWAAFEEELPPGTEE